MATNFNYSDRCRTLFVQLRFKKGTSKSPVFIFQQQDCYLQLVKEFESGCSHYRIYVKSASHAPMHLQPFHIKIYVQYKDSIIYFDEDFITSRPESASIWSIPKLTFKMKINGRVKRGTLIQFLILFNEVYGLPLQPATYKTASKPMSTLYLDDNHRPETSEDFNELLENSRSMPPDVQLKCGDHVIWVHKAVLCARSEVFAAMLNRETLECRIGLLEITDMDKAIFPEFVRYLYTGTLMEFDLAKVEKLYEAGDKYAVNGLTRGCVPIFESSLTDENESGILTLADAHNGDMLSPSASWRWKSRKFLSPKVTQMWHLKCLQRE